MPEQFSITDMVNILASKIDWSRYFDRIYCIHYLSYKERFHEITEELQKVGIWDSGICEFKFTFNTPFDAAIRNRLPHNSVRFDDPRHQNTVTSVSLAYYRICQEALGRNFNHILVIEDDCIFIAGPNDISLTLEHIPNDWDYVHFDKILAPEEQSRLRLSKPINHYISSYYGGYWGTACTAFSAKAMRMVIELLEEKLYTSDGLLENHDDPRLEQLNRYVANLSLCYQRNIPNAYKL